VPGAVSSADFKKFAFVSASAPLAGFTSVTPRLFTPVR
jgi:hypothetical protein